MMDDREVLALHRQMVGTPSVSGNEGLLASFVADYLSRHGVEVSRLGDNLYAVAGERGPLVCLNSHLDTVPPAPGWSKPSAAATVLDGKVFGLGANDAKASVAAMMAAFLRLRALGSQLSCRVLLTLVIAEETGGNGTAALVPHLASQALTPDAVIVGEPTGLDIAISQKGLLIVELIEHGRACHAAHARALGAENALRLLAHDMAALDALGLSSLPHPELGPVTLEPTMVSGGTARNVLPASASCIYDIRTNPQPDHERLVAKLSRAVCGEVKVLSNRLRPCAIDRAHPLVRAGLVARPEARLFGSRAVSDLVFFSGIPGIKVGPGDTERSHIPDEFVFEDEIIAGAGFYERALLAFASEGAGERVGEIS